MRGLQRVRARVSFASTSLRTPLACRRAPGLRAVSGGADDDEDAYEDLRQARSIKPLAFYEAEAVHRRYFYFIDKQGRLFLEDTLPKNVATSLKSDKFLDFFWRMLRPNEAGLHAEYPFVSPCGSEMNFIKVADSPVVFRDLVDEDRQLRFAATQTVPFAPDRLRLSQEGRLYVAFDHKRLGHDVLGLVASALASRLAEHITFVEEEHEEQTEETKEGGEEEEKSEEEKGEEEKGQERKEKLVESGDAFVRGGVVARFEWGGRSWPVLGVHRRRSV